MLTLHRPTTRLADLLAPYGGDPLAFAVATRRGPAARVRLALWLRATRGQR